MIGKATRGFEACNARTSRFSVLKQLSRLSEGGGERGKLIFRAAREALIKKRARLLAISAVAGAEFHAAVQLALLEQLSRFLHRAFCEQLSSLGCLKAMHVAFVSSLGYLERLRLYQQCAATINEHDRHPALGSSFGRLFAVITTEDRDQLAVQLWARDESAYCRPSEGCKRVIRHPAWAVCWAPRHV
eukprot:7382612-Prymnesium_polylepis.2